MKKIIAVDVDDVLAANAKGFVEFSNRVWGTNLTVADYDEHWGELWQVDWAETERRADYLHASDMFERYEHFADALPVLQRLALRFDLVVTTSRRRVIQTITEAWLDKYFTGVFSNVHFVGIYDNKITDQSVRMTKSDLLMEVGASYVIDDQIKHCLGASERGIQAVLFGDYPWNRADILPKLVTRCTSWQEVGAYFDARAA